MQKLLGVAFLLLFALPLHAQKAPKTSVTGTIINAETGAPLPNAEVTIPDLGKETLTDEHGQFRFGGVAQGRQNIVVSNLGYASTRFDVTVGAEQPVTLKLPPEPLTLGGLNITVDRLQTRRRMVPYSTRVVDRTELARTGVGSAADLVARLTWTSRCTSGWGLFGSACSSNPMSSCSTWSSRGCPQDPDGAGIFSRIWIDDHPALGGTEELASYLPSELYMVEVFGGGKQIRVYTLGYIEMMAHSRRTLPPIQIW